MSGAEGYTLSDFEHPAFDKDSFDRHVDGMLPHRLAKTELEVI